jgi:hypothetical protein
MVALGSGRSGFLVQPARTRAAAIKRRLSFLGMAFMGGASA